MHFLRKPRHKHHGFELHLWPGLGQRDWDLEKNQRETCSMRVGESCVGPTDPWLLSLYKDTYVRSTGGLNWAMGCLWCEGVESETAGEDCGIRCLQGGLYVCLSEALVRGSVYVYECLCVSTSVFGRRLEGSLSFLCLDVSLPLFLTYFFTLLPPACFFIESEEFLSRFLFYQSFCFYWQKQVSICAVLVQSRSQEWFLLWAKRSQTEQVLTRMPGTLEKLGRGRLNFLRAQRLLEVRDLHVFHTVCNYMFKYEWHFLALRRGV